VSFGLIGACLRDLWEEENLRVQYHPVLDKRAVRLRSASVVEGRHIRVLWEGGASEVKDISPALANNRSFVRLRKDDALFRTARVKADGSGVKWADGSEISAVSLLELPQTLMDNREFCNIMSDLNLSVEGLSALLGLSRRVIADYRRDKSIPKHVALSLRYLVERRGR
jgi:hypothetical protein